MKGFLRDGRAPDTTKVLLCVGDSITEGVGSADWVAKVRERVGGQGTQVVNAGVAGDLSWNVLQRLDAVIQCDPDTVVLLVGTNDVAALSFSPLARFLLRLKGVRREPTLTWYLENVAEIFRRLQTETHAQLAVLEIPMTGEDLASPTNACISRYNAALREVALEFGVECLPLYERLAALLPPDHSPSPYTAKIGPVVKAQVQRHVLRREWEDIATSNGLALLVDHTHLGERAAEVVADLAVDFDARH